MLRLVVYLNHENEKMDQLGKTNGRLSPELALCLLQISPSGDV